MWTSPLKWYEQAQSTIRSVEAGIDSMIGIPRESTASSSSDSLSRLADPDAAAHGLDPLPGSPSSLFHNGPVSPPRLTASASSSSLASRRPSSPVAGSVSIPASVSELSLAQLLNGPELQPTRKTVPAFHALEQVPTAPPSSSMNAMREDASSGDPSSQITSESRDSFASAEFTDLNPALPMAMAPDQDARAEDSLAGVTGRSTPEPESEADTSSTVEYSGMDILRSPRIAPAIVSEHESDRSRGVDGACSTPSSDGGADESVSADAASEVDVLRSVLLEREKQLEHAQVLNAALNESVESLSRQMERDDSGRAEIHRVAHLEEEIAGLQSQVQQLKDENCTLISKSSTLQASLLRFEGDPEKDAVIAQLTREGEKLSRKQLDLETVIRNLRAREKSHEQGAEALQAKISSLERGVAVVDALRAENVELQNKVRELRVASETAASRLEEQSASAGSQGARAAELRSSLERSQEECAALKVQLLELQHAHDSALVSVREELQRSHEAEMGRVESALQSRVHDLEQLVAQLRETIKRNTERSSWREEQLHAEISDLQARLRQSEERYVDQVAISSESTRPLLRQIEALQAAAATRQEAWTEIEQQLTERALAHEEAYLQHEDLVRDLERRSQSQALRVQMLESQLASEQKSQQQFAADLMEAQSEADSQRVAAEKAQRKVGALQAREAAISNELRRVETSRADLQRQLELAELRLRTFVETAAVRANDNPLTTRSGNGPSGSDCIRFSNDDESEPGNISPKPAIQDNAAAKSAPVPSLGGVRMDRRGEADALRERIQQLEDEKRRLEDRLVALSLAYEEAALRAASGQLAQQQLGDVDRRLQVALEMIGEKEERIEELKLDLDDVRQSYRRDIAALAARD